MNHYHFFPGVFYAFLTFLFIVVNGRSHGRYRGKRRSVFHDSPLAARSNWRVPVGITQWRESQSVKLRLIANASDRSTRSRGCNPADGFGYFSRRGKSNIAQSIRCTARPPSTERILSWIIFQLELHTQTYSTERDVVSARCSHAVNTRNSRLPGRVGAACHLASRRRGRQGVARFICC